MLFWYMISLLALFGDFLVRDKVGLAVLRGEGGWEWAGPEDEVCVNNNLLLVFYV